MPLALALVLAGSAVARARTIAVRVFDDTNGDGKPAAGEPGVPGAIVALGTSVFAATDEHGELTLDADTGIAWVRVPGGFVPGPVWAAIDGKDHVDLALHRLAAPARGPLTFVATSDSHLSYAHAFWDDLGDAAVDATARTPAPAFFTILGDISQNDEPAQYALVDAELAALDVPFVPVPGNHDWYDGGTAWHAHYGPDNYSFDLGTVHFVVWNMAMTDDEILGFFEGDLAQVAPDLTVVAMTHGPPSQRVADGLRRLGVDDILTGHTHTNRVLDHDGLIELNTEPLLMGGLDFTPAGYRVITIDRGVLTSVHRTVVDHPAIALAAPAAGGCMAAGGGTLIATTQLDPDAAQVTARIDCATPISLRFAGGWSWRAELGALAPGAHSVTLDARAPGGAHLTRTTGFEVCTADAPPLAGIDWPQLGGGPTHTGATPRELAPPLATRWTTSVGGHVLHGAPAIAHGMIYLTTTDLAGGDGGGVVALDLESGAVRWRAPSALPIRGAATVIGDLVAAVQVDGTVLGLDATSGALRWRYELGLEVSPRGAATYAAAVADAGDLIVGNQRRLATIDAASGRPLWVRDPVRGNSEFPSLATIATGDGVAVGVFDRELGGVLAWDRVSGALLWQLTGDVSLSINASPVISDGLVYLSNGATEVVALELGTGRQRWHTKLDPTGYDWAIATIGTPAVARGVIVVPTLWRDLAGLDAASGRLLWRFAAAGAGPLRTTHYRGAGEAGFASSPVITGDLVWAADTGGHLTALDLHTGAVLWRASLGVPVLAGLGTTGSSLIVASYDGTVRALAPVAHERAPISGARCDAPRSTGCCDARGGPGRPGAIAAIAAALYARRRRRRRMRSATRPSSTPADGPPAPPALHV